MSDALTLSDKFAAFLATCGYKPLESRVCASVGNVMAVFPRDARGLDDATALASLFEKAQMKRVVVVPPADDDPVWLVSAFLK
jgi:hypothetical protein